MARTSMNKLAVTLAYAHEAYHHSADAQTPSLAQIDVRAAKFAFAHSAIPQFVGVWTLPTVAAHHALLPLLLVLTKQLVSVTTTMLHPTKPPYLVPIMLKLYYGFDSTSNVDE